MPSELLFFGVIAIVHDTCPRRRCNSIWSVNASLWTHLARTALWIWLYATGPAGLEPATPGFGGDSDSMLGNGLPYPMRDASVRRCRQARESPPRPRRRGTFTDQPNKSQDSSHAGPYEGSRTLNRRTVVFGVPGLPIVILLLIAVPVVVAFLGVNVTSQVPAFFKRIEHRAVRFCVFLSVLMTQVPRTFAGCFRVRFAVVALGSLSVATMRMLVTLDATLEMTYGIGLVVMPR